MNAYNPIATMKRLEGAGLARSHAEAIASEIGRRKADALTMDQLEAALGKQTIKISTMMFGIVALAGVILCDVVSLVVSH